MNTFFRSIGRIISLLIICASILLLAYLVIFERYSSWQDLYDNGFALTTTIVAALTGIYGFRRMGRGMRYSGKGMYGWGFMSGIVIPLLVYAAYFMMLWAA